MSEKKIRYVRKKKDNVQKKKKNVQNKIFQCPQKKIKSPNLNSKHCIKNDFAGKTKSGFEYHLFYKIVEIIVTMVFFLLFLVALNPVKSKIVNYSFILKCQDAKGQQAECF
jgi:hypothetical protein